MRGWRSSSLDVSSSPRSYRLVQFPDHTFAHFYNFSYFHALLTFKIFSIHILVLTFCPLLVLIVLRTACFWPLLQSWVNVQLSFWCLWWWFCSPNTKRALSFLNSLFEVKTMLIGTPGGLSVRVAFFCTCHTITRSRTSPEVQWCSEKCLIILQPFLATSCHQSETFYTIAQPTFRNIWLIYELSMLEDFEMEQKYVTNMH